MKKRLNELSEAYERYLVKVTYSGETAYLISIRNADTNSNEFVLTQTGCIAASTQPQLLIHHLFHNPTLKITDKGATLTWAAEALLSDFEIENTFDLDSLISLIHNKGLTTKSISEVCYFIQLVNDYRWQTDNIKLSELLNKADLKKVLNIYSEYIFWNKETKDLTFETQLNSLNRQQFTVDFIHLIKSFFTSIEQL